MTILVAQLYWIFKLLPPAFPFLVIVFPIATKSWIIASTCSVSGLKVFMDSICSFQCRQRRSELALDRFSETALKLQQLQRCLNSGFCNQLFQPAHRSGASVYSGHMFGHDKIIKRVFLRNLMEWFLYLYSKLTQHKCSASLQKTSLSLKLFPSTPSSKAIIIKRLTTEYYVILGTNLSSFFSSNK